MNQFLFVLGSNWQLSLAELDAVLRNSQFKGKIVDYSANIAIVEFEKLHEEKHYINKLMELQFILGGCQKIVKVIDFINILTIYNAFPIKIEKFGQIERTRTKILNILNDNLDFIFPKIKKESLFFAISIYPNLYDEEYYSKILVKHFLPFLNKEIMKLLKEKGAEKSLYYKYPEENIKSGNLNPIFPHHVIKYGLFNKDRAEIVFGFTEEGVYLGRTFTADDPNFKKRIDEERPFKEFKSSISPKLALIMLNFLNLFDNRERKKILDPFVGSGTILIFALIEDFQIYGSDIENEKVENTIRNLNWVYRELEEPVPILLNEHIKLLNVNNLTDHFEKEFFDGICTEPTLGPFYKQKPYYNEVKELLDTKLEQMYENFFREAYQVLKPHCRISIIAPIIETVDGGDLQINLEKIAIKHNFRQIPILDVNRIINKSNIKLQFKSQPVKSLIEAKKEQIVKRKIYIFEKVS